MDIDVAEQLSKLVSLLEGHPIASIGAVFAIVLILGSQKEGLFSKFLGYLEARQNHEAEKEERRFEIIRLIETRREPLLPGLELTEKEIGK